jgi:hypothetical protein
MTVAAGEALFAPAGVEHVEAIVANNIAMAKETEDLDLPPATIHKAGGVLGRSRGRGQGPSAQLACLGWLLPVCPDKRQAACCCAVAQS